MHIQKTYQKKISMHKKLSLHLAIRVQEQELRVFGERAGKNYRFEFVQLFGNSKVRVKKILSTINIRSPHGLLSISACSFCLYFFLSRAVKETSWETKHHCASRLEFGNSSKQGYFIALFRPFLRQYLIAITFINFVLIWQEFTRVK